MNVSRSEFIILLCITRICFSRAPALSWTPTLNSASTMVWTLPTGDTTSNSVVSYNITYFQTSKYDMLKSSKTVVP